MPLLDELSRRLHAMMPTWLQQARQPASEPTAYTRIGRNPIFQMSPEDYESASSRVGYSHPPSGFTLDPGDDSSFLDRLRSPAIRGMIQTASQHPTVVVPKESTDPNLIPHEAIHALLFGHEPSARDVLGLIPSRGAGNLRRLGYSEQSERAAEIPARLASGGAYGLAMGEDEGQDALMKYLKMLPPEVASKFARAAKIPYGQPAARTTDASFQKPNDTF